MGKPNVADRVLGYDTMTN